MTQETKADTPLYQHDCSLCTFLGNYRDEKEGAMDLYYCGQNLGGWTVIARRSSEGSDYTSGAAFASGIIASLTEAKKRAIALGLYVGSK